MQVTDSQTIVRKHDYFLECDVDEARDDDSETTCRFVVFVGVDDAQCICAGAEGHDTPPVTGIVMRCETHNGTFLADVAVDGATIRLRPTEILYTKQEGSDS